MSIGFAIAIAAVPYFDLLDEEEESLAAQLLEAGDEPAARSAMDRSRRRLAQGVDAVVRSLPAAARGDTATSRAVAYALVGLADERMLHHPAGGMGRWQERLLEFELYASALAGQEIVSRAQSAAYGAAGSGDGGDASQLAPLYLGVFRAGFEGSLRGDTLGLNALIASLEEAVGATRDRPAPLAAHVRPSRIGLSPVPLVALGLLAWLAGGFGVWMALPANTLDEASRIAERVAAGLAAAPAGDPLERSVGPSGLPAPGAPRQGGER